MEVLRLEKIYNHPTYGRCADVPSTRAQECIKTNQDLLVKFEDESMLLTVADLLNKRKYISNKEWGGKNPYRLWGYSWRPVKQEV
jgi:hypothetical protein